MCRPEPTCLRWRRHCIPRYFPLRSLHRPPEFARQHSCSPEPFHFAVGSPINSRDFVHSSSRRLVSSVAEPRFMPIVDRASWCDVSDIMRGSKSDRAGNRRPCSSANERRTVPLTDGARKIREQIKNTQGEGRRNFKICWRHARSCVRALNGRGRDTVNICASF